ncbi:hypothetical protein ACFP81_01730 [Deinococcus lacus]|uniref:Lipoprotein n=1 Tax=Deinococcus lacus TaxID=392561 RepID=A0ABW1Y9B5_9DEIO
MKKLIACAALLPLALAACQPTPAVYDATGKWTLTLTAKNADGVEQTKDLETPITITMQDKVKGDFTGTSNFMDMALTLSGNTVTGKLKYSTPIMDGNSIDCTGKFEGNVYTGTCVPMLNNTPVEGQTATVRLTRQ